MLKNILNQEGVKKLNQKQLQSINGGVGFTVTCTFSDGTSWSGHTHDFFAAQDMVNHCSTSGGDSSYHAHLFDFIDDIHDH
ncbi:hypothetical protein GWK08_01460 [Leptobacterium flavescens]|uniref:Bacteriocin n=1 Tax=Leptobacterium flavescens TaxID=472055 RepID=A0A6P0UP23_9FLAO|nr:hypothetical protein [Leptobacterium flavescens]NER12096.1 hypothetical protein [Leptobacterium flavescens]